jgi:ribokinase
VVLGHIEWAELLSVPGIPAAGGWVEAEEIVAEPAGGGATGACQMAKLTAPTLFFTSLADDDTGRSARARLEHEGVRVEAATHPPPQRRALISIDARGERTITVVGRKVWPRACDSLPWEELDHADVVVLYCADAEAIRLARRASVLVATARWWDTIAASGVRVDALVGSASDPEESRDLHQLDPTPDLLVMTQGSAGGTYTPRGGSPRNYDPAAPPPGPIVDTYGCGDSFLAALAFALARGDGTEEAVGFAAVAGAAVATGRGALAAQLRHVSVQRG